jgi:LytS/YehU family sensor histidine kinase
VALIAGALFGEVLLLALQGLDWGALRTRRFWSDAVFWMAIGHGNATIHFLQQRAAGAVEALHEAQMRRVVLGHQAQEARLNVLRAQIEPHFLFNALANMRRLCRNDVGSGIAMLHNIGRYLSAALPRMHHAQATLGQEADLVSAYLAILEVRMGARLRYVVDVPGELAGRLFPPMMLLTLAENAIKHGLAPAPQGGSVVIRARAEENLLEISVADDGVGFDGAPTGGYGSGLANIRERLAAMYGNAGSLGLASNPASGVTATIRMPLPPRATPERD